MSFSCSFLQITDVGFFVCAAEEIVGKYIEDTANKDNVAMIFTTRCMSKV